MPISSIERGVLARDNFLQGCNCAQAVLLAFSDVTGLNDAVAMRLASSFGGGMGRMREVCGTVSGALMVLGLATGYDAASPTEAEDKAAHYARVQTFARRFREAQSSIVCREILANHAARLKAADAEQLTAMASTDSTPTARTEAYYRARPCAAVAELSARLLDEYLHELGALS